MSTAPNAANVIVGRGKLYFGRFADDGSFPKTFLEMGNCRQIRTTPEITKIELKNTRTKASTTYAEAITEQQVAINIELDEYSEDNVALALMGDVTQFTQASTPVTGEVLATAANAAQGRVYFTALRDISSVVVKSGATTLVLGTDYQILDDNAGAIEIFAVAPNWQAASALTVDYTGAAITSLQKVRMATKGSIKGQLRFLGDPVIGPRMEARWWNVSLTPNGEMDFLTDEFGSLNIAGTVLDDSIGAFGGSAAEPFGTILYRTDT